MNTSGRVVSRRQTALYSLVILVLAVSPRTDAMSNSFENVNDGISTPADHTLDRFANDTDVIGWEPHRSRNASDYIFPDRITTLISSHKTCSATYPPLVVVIISSSSDYFDRRTAIRRTWADSIDKKFNISVAFFLGLSKNETVNDLVRHESEEFGDIIVEDFIDTYNNLTIKTLMELKWVKNNCQNTPYMVKMDDDVYINAKNFAAFVNKVAQNHIPDLLFGMVSFCRDIAIRNVSSKWYIPTYMYAEEFYPDYLGGDFYFSTMEIALRMYKEALRTPMIHIDDVFVTGICTKQIGIRPATHYLFSLRYYGGKASMKECTAEDKYLITHSSHISVEQMYAVHAFVSNCSSSNNDELPFSSVNFQKEFSYCPNLLFRPDCTICCG